MRISRILVLATAGLAVVAFAGVLQPRDAAGADTQATSSGGVTALGTGSVDVTPDRARFAFGTVTQARSAAAALEASSSAVARVVAALRREGLAQADIQTSEVGVYPRWSEAGEDIVGYTASNTVTATVRRLSQVGAIIDAAVAAGANQVAGPSMVASDHASAYRNALREAVADARVKAQALAAASGLTIGRITTVTEFGASPSPLPAQDAERTAAAPTVEPGTQRIEASVSVTFSAGS